MIIPTILIMVSLSPSKKSITGFDLEVSTIVKLTPIISAKKTICSISPPEMAENGFVGTMRTIISTRSGGCTDDAISG